MNLLQMTLAGGAMALAVVLARALLLNRLPKATFVLLWALVALRLLVPVSIPFPLSAASLLQGAIPIPAATPAADPAADPAAVPTPDLASDTRPIQAETTDHPATSTVSPATPPATATSEPDAPAAESPRSPGAFGFFGAPEPLGTFEAFSAALPVAWAAGSALCATGFALVYLRCRRDFATSLPVDDPRARAWLAQNRDRLRRPLDLRQSDLVSTPLTYGVLRPVILVPRGTDWSREDEVRYMLAHELVHVRRFDALAKLVLAACACVHWFNPLVWAMYVLANRDLELSCDERVVRGFGTGSRAAYARALIAMEETKSGLAPLASGFSKTATEERIVAIMHIKKTSLLAVAASASLVVGIPAALATSAAPHNPAQTDPAQPDRPAAAAAFDPADPLAPPSAQPAFDTSDWGGVVSSARYTADDWALVQALNVPGVENLTVAAFTDLALDVADTPEKRDTLVLLMGDPDVASQASTNGAARFVADVMAPALLKNSRFPTAGAGTGADGDARVDADGDARVDADARCLIVVSFDAADAVASADADAQAQPFTPESTLAEGGHDYYGGELCYTVDVRVLDADAVTVGAYVQAIEDTQSAVDALIRNLSPAWNVDAGEKLTAALHAVDRDRSSENLTVETGWFFVDNQGSSGSQGGLTSQGGSDSQGGLTSQVTLSNTWGSAKEINVDTAADAIETATGGTAEGATENATGLTVAERMEPFEKYGLAYRNGNLWYGSDPVNTFVDMGSGGVFLYNSTDQSASGLYLRAIYDKDGRLTGLKEFDPAAVSWE